MFRRTLLNTGVAAAAIAAAAIAGIDLAEDADLTQTAVAKLERAVARLHTLDACHGAAGLWDVAATRARGIAALLDHGEYSDPRRRVREVADVLAWYRTTPYGATA
ncbi:hypothetical protein WEI85_16715 [Actinomycetes bacterium KLBMP 9797]